MSVAVAEALLDEAGLARALAPKSDLVAERDLGDGRFEAVEGPFRSYHREVSYAPADDGRFRVRQRTEFRLAIPIFGPAFAVGYRRELRRVGAAPAGWPWWHPAARVDVRQAIVLSVLAVLSIATGYLGTLLTQTITYAAADFGAGTGAQGVALAAVRTDVLLSLLLVAIADRRGRRRVLLATATAGAVATAAGALAPSLPLLIATQVAARGFVTASALLIAVMAAEEMPAGARAYAVSLLAMAGALGAGLAVMLLPVADVGAWGWRVLFAAGLAWLVAVAWSRGRLPETRRFEAHQEEIDEGSGQDGPSTGRLLSAETLRRHRQRLWLLAVSGFLLSMFVAPASQFQNEYLRTERGFSAARISLFTLSTNTPGGIGIILGGRLADVRGRRIVAGVGIAVGVGATVVTYHVTGWPLWAWSVVGAVVGAAVVPALGVYGPELFPTGQRGRSNGLISAAGRIGSVVGLVVTGVLSAAIGSIGPALVVLAVGPAILVVLILVAYPETAHLELEQINPEDAAPAS